MSMLRNVLTYMGLGPDEDYDDGYLYESADNEIDLTEDEPALDEGVDESFIDTSVSPFGDPDDGVVEEKLNGGDPHALRDRPDWLEPPAPTEADATAGPVAGQVAASSGRRRISIDDDEQPASPRGRHDQQRPRGRVRPLRAVPQADLEDDDNGLSVRAVEEEPPARAVPAAQSEPSADVTVDNEPTPEVREVKPKALSPQSFGDAKTLADEFKAQVPVVMNLQDVDRELARRLIDFASGICYAMDGSMEKIASQVFLLTPQEVEVSDEDRRRIGQRGYDR